VEVTIVGKIIGLSGKRDDGSSAGAGKDEVARILVQR
jgi:hypothetical protein